MWFILCEGGTRWKQSISAPFGIEAVSFLASGTSAALLLPGQPKTLSNPNVRQWEMHMQDFFFRPVQFLCDTYTAQDLKSDNMHKLQRAEGSDCNAWSHRRAVMPRCPPSAAPCIIPQPTLRGTLPSFADVWIINHISYQRPIPCHRYSFPKLKAMCVKYSSSPEQVSQTFLNLLSRKGSWLKRMKWVFLKNHPNLGV